MSHLDQLNIARPKAPMGCLQTEEGNATSLRIFGEESQLVNMSAWESAEALWDFEERLTQLRTHGPTPHAFTFKERFPAPDAEPSRTA